MTSAGKAFLAASIAALMALASPVRAITLEESVRMALDKSEGAAMVREGAAAGRAMARAGVSELLPRLELEGGYYRLGTNADPVPFFPAPESEYNATISAAQLLWAGGRITGGFRLKGVGMRRADLTERIGLASVRYRVSAMYLKVLFERDRMRVLADRVGQAGQELADASALLAEGLAAPLDVRQARLALNTAREALLGAELGYRQSLVDFNIELGAEALEPDGMLVPEGELLRTAILSADLAELEAMVATRGLPELKLGSIGREEAALRHKIARGARMPELAFIASATTSGPDTSEMDESWMAGLNLKFHIYDGGLRSARSLAAMHEKKSAELEDDRGLGLVKGRVYSMRMRAESVSGRIALRGETVEMAAKNYEDARAEYREGLITLTRLGEFNMALLEARLGLLGLYLEEQGIGLEAALMLGRVLN